MTVIKAEPRPDRMGKRLWCMHGLAISGWAAGFLRLATDRIAGALRVACGEAAVRSVPRDDSKRGRALEFLRGNPMLRERPVPTTACAIIPWLSTAPYLTAPGSHLVAAGQTEKQGIRVRYADRRKSLARRPLTDPASSA
ncbi:hypothetical protein ACFB49_21950 [Sphingomonas sp. DBB INV C78]